MVCRTCSEALKRALPLFAAGCLLVGCKPASAPAQHDTLPAVQVFRVQEDQPEKVLFAGRYSASRIIPLAPTQAGRLRKIAVVSGQSVHQGDTLALLEDRVLQEQVAQAEGEADAARADAAQAEATYKRSRGLDTAGGLSAGTVEERGYARRMAQGKARSAQAALMQARIQLAEATLRAPEDGQILSVTGVAGTLVGAGTEVVRMTAGAPEVRLQVPSPSAWRVGDRAEVSLPADPAARPVQAVVQETGAVDGASQMQTLRLRLEQTLAVPLNSLVRVTLPAQRAAPVMRVPLTALVETHQRHAQVWALTDGDTPRLVLRHVDIAGLRGADALVEGLKAGERIVTSGEASFRPDQAVQIISQASGR